MKVEERIDIAKATAARRVVHRIPRRASTPANAAVATATARSPGRNRAASPSADVATATARTPEFSEGERT